MLKKYSSVIVLLCLALSCGMMMVSCSTSTNGEVEILSEVSSAPEVTSRTETASDLTESTPSDDMEEEAEGSVKDALANTKTLPIYCINDDGSDIESVIVYLDENAEVNAVTIVDEVVGEFSNHNLTIGIDKVTEDEDGNVIVSFTKDTVPVKGVEEDVEYLILDCISQSILDDDKTSQAVIFQIEGNAYESDNISFKENEAYNWR